MGSTLYLVTPIAILLGWLVLGEAPPAVAPAGGALCLAGVYISARSASSVSASSGRLSGRYRFTREPQRDTSGIARRGLNAVERDLDDELWTHQHGDPAPLDLPREKRLRLPCQQLVRHSLERLADHHELAGRRVARTEVQVRETALTPAVAPLGAEHDQVEGAHGLHLPPGLPAPPGGVRRRRILDDDALVAGSERGVEHPLGFLDVGREGARNLQLRCERGEARA